MPCKANKINRFETIKTGMIMMIERKISLILISALFFLSLNGQIAAQVNGYKLKTVVIDAGHGGKDPGSMGKHSMEKDIVLDIALKLGKYIETLLPEVKVVYTRTKDEFIPLYQRADIANKNKADLFISIHANGNKESHVDGTETLVLGLHRADENFEVAKAENSVILLEDDYNARYEGFDPSSPESYIIFSLMQNLYLEQSINFAAYVQNQFKNRAARKDRGVKQQGLLVLARTSMPGVLIETGFMTNPEEEKYLMSEEGKDYIASAIFRAFRDYKNMMENKNTYLAGNALKYDSGKIGISSDTLPVQIIQQALNDKTSKSNDSTVVPEKMPVVVFKVQILASVKRINKNDVSFKGVEDIEEHKVGNMYKYTVGKSESFSEAVALSRQMQKMFPGAFVIAVKEGQIIPLEQALKEVNNTAKNN